MSMTFPVVEPKHVDGYETIYFGQDLVLHLLVSCQRNMCLVGLNGMDIIHKNNSKPSKLLIIRRLNFPQAEGHKVL